MAKSQRPVVMDKLSSSAITYLSCINKSKMKHQQISCWIHTTPNLVMATRNACLPIPQLNKSIFSIVFIVVSLLSVEQLIRLEDIIQPLLNTCHHDYCSLIFT
jgi:hypothetical protein